jgi:hypothetical protein
MTTTSTTTSFRDLSEDVYLLFIDNTFTASLRSFKQHNTNEYISKTVHQAVVILFYAASSIVEVRKFELWERESTSLSNDDIRRVMTLFQHSAAQQKCFYYDIKVHSKQPWRLKEKPTNEYCTTGQIHWPIGLVPEDTTKSKYLRHVCK